MAFAFIGCSATDSAYNATKKVYQVGEAVVEVTGVESDELSNINKVATKYDEARTAVREVQEEKK